MDLFNNREVSLFIWFCIALAFSLSKETIRKSLRDLIKAAFHKALVRIYLLMLIYIAFLIYMLSEVGLWDFDQTKTTIIWTFTAALVTLFRHDQIREDPNYFKKAVRDNINFVAVIEFVVTFYSFPFLVEFILVPASFFVVAVYEFSKLQEENKIVVDFFDKLSTPFGLLVLTYAGHNFYIYAGEFFVWGTLTDFTTPIILSLLFLPFVYMVAVYSSYERVFGQIEINSSNRDISRYAKWKAIFGFHLRFKLLERWSHATFISPLNSREEVRSSIEDMRELAEYERKDNPVPLEDGWMPIKAKDFLREEGFKAGDYKYVGEGEWFVSSNNVEIGDDILPNSLWYYVSGNPKIAKDLKLKLYVHQPDQEQVAKEKLIEVGRVLINKALGEELDEALIRAIMEARNEQITAKGKSISVIKEDWPNGKPGQYDISILIHSE